MKRGKSTIIWIFIISAGSIIGNIIGEALSGLLPILKISQHLGFGPAVLDLNFFNVTFGFGFDMNLAGLIGIITVMLIFRKWQ
ncbi:MAG: DUF4321 domain-containing protein [Tissierellales bacterium]|jgi:hypothetical protein|nr:DUF4321 domain-containing protein [Tissierellales bacterium]MBN2827850.1 DUF4321 domain-containing protein [Tissierellales bacterium]